MTNKVKYTLSKKNTRGRYTAYTRVSPQYTPDLHDITSPYHRGTIRTMLENCGFRLSVGWGDSHTSMLRKCS